MKTLFAAAAGRVVGKPVGDGLTPAGESTRDPGHDPGFQEVIEEQMYRSAERSPD